jgi:tetratricopeptide (TPR) repeat protein
MTASPPTAAAKSKNEASLSSDSSVLPYRRFDRQKLALCLGLIAVVFVCYSSVIRNQFVTFDDNLYITENPHLTSGLTWDTVGWAFTYYQANWHPLTWLSHALDVSLFGLKPAGPHLVNVLIHAINAVLLFLLLEFATGFRWRSLMVAALFALHPINVESVAWAAERKNVLSALFFLLALYAYERYARQPERGQYKWVVGLYALALMAKPQVITFPFLLVLWDYWPLGRVAAWEGASSPTSADFPKMPIRQLLWEKWPLLVLSGISAILTMQAQQAGGAVKDLSQYSPPLRVETAVIAYARYLGMALWPSKLVAMYPHATRLYPAWQVGGAVLILLLITGLVLRAREQRYLAVGWFWYLGSLVPMIGLVQVGVQEVADRYAYISFLGLFVMVVWLVADWASDWEKARRISARWLAVPALSCLVALGVFTYRQVGYWHDSDSFFRRTLALTRDNYVAHSGLAKALHDEGKTEESMAEVYAVLAIRPSDPGANMILGDYEHGQGHLAAAVERYKIAAHTDARILRAKACASMGFTYHQMKQPTDAKKSFEMSLRADPNQPVILVQLGLIAQVDENDTPTAARDYERAMQLQPTDVGLVLLANALLEEGGHDDEAHALLQRAARLSKNIDEAEKQAKALLGEK